MAAGCGAKSDVHSVVTGFFEEVNKSNFESAKAIYLSAALKNELDAPGAFRSHKSVHDSFVKLAGIINSIEIEDRQLKGEQTSVGVTLTSPLGTKFVGSVDLIKEDGRQWKISHWGEFNAVGSVHGAAGLRECFSGRYGAGVAELQAALTENPSDSLILQALGSCYMGIPDLVHAEQVLLKATNMHPDLMTTPYVLLGTIYSSQNRLPEAERAFRKAIDNKPVETNDQIICYNALAWFYADHGMKLDDAIDLSRKSLSLSSENPDALASIGWAYYRKGDRDNSVVYLGRAVSKAPANKTIQDRYLEVSVTPAVHNSRAQSYLGTGDAGRALAECDAALRADPNNEEAKKTKAAAITMLAQQHVNSAQLLYDQRQYDQAISQCDQALALDPQNQQASALKARIQETKKVLGYQ